MKMSHSLRMRLSVSKASLLPACALAGACVLAGCNNSSSSSNSATNTATPLSGTVSAPGGAIAFNQPSGLRHMLAAILFGRDAHAAITGVSPVGAGVTVELIEVDAAGNQVGAALASTTTDANGAYSLTPPANFVPASKYVIRASGTTQTLDTRVTSSSGNDVDPLTDAVSNLVTTTASDLSVISTTEIVTIQGAVDGISQDIDPTGLDAQTLSTTLQTAATNDPETANQISSTATAGIICGNVKDSASTNLENIVIIVRDFGNWVTRAKTRTDANGDYCVNVPYGSGKDYIIGAFNFTGTSYAASEWWSAGGTAYSQIDAEKVSVPDTTTVTKNFALEDGARIKGTVTAEAGGSLAAGTPLQNIKVLIRSYQNFFPLAGKRTNANGGYRINVIPGSYQVGAQNRTLQPYASEYYTSGGGTNTYYKAGKVTLTKGQTTTLAFALAKGYKVAGTVLDNVGGNPVAGIRVRVNLDPTSSQSGGPAQRIRTNKVGKYRLWLMPDKYFIETYGQTSTTLDMTAANASYSPTGPVTSIATNVKYNGVGVSQAKVWLLDNGNKTVSQEVSNSDGSITLYCKTCGSNYKAYVLVDDAKAFGTSVYDGKTDLANATLIDANQSTLPTDITLPAAGTLNVKVQDGGTVQQNFKTRIISAGNVFIRVQRTHGDGGYIMSLPPGTFVVKMIGDVDLTNCSVTIPSAGSTTNLVYDVTANTCTVS